MFLKISFSIIGVFAYIYGCIWLFNHISGWLGIGAFVAGIIIAGQLLINKYKN